MVHCCEPCHARCGRKPILIECKYVFGVAAAPYGCICEDSVLAFSPCFCLNENPTTDRRGKYAHQSIETILEGASNLLGYLHYTPLQPPEFNHRYSLPSPKSVLVEPLVELVSLPDESHRQSGICRRIQWVFGALVVFSSTRFGAWVRRPVGLGLPRPTLEGTPARMTSISSGWTG